MRVFIRPAMLAGAVLASSASAAIADRVCDELWFTRNWVFDQAGYCFGSALGQAQFDNAGCTGQQVTLTPSQTAFVAGLRRLETLYDCSVDTSRTTLDMPDLALRKRLTVQPMPYEEMAGWGCLGYLGPPIAPQAGPDTGASQLGRINAGDWLGVGGYEPVNGWVFVRAFGPSWEGFRSGGWMRPGPEIRCEREAG